MEVNKKAGIEKKTDVIDFKILDGLRGIAAMYVVFNHARGNLFIGGTKYALIKSVSEWDIKEKLFFSALRLTSLGREFVILFFILSGFSIAFSLTRSNSISGFYLRRAIRIYPPYVLSLAWAFIVFELLKHFVPGVLPEDSLSVFSSWNAALKNLFYIDNGSLIIQFWSLKYEVIFYLLVPFFVLKKELYLATSLVLAIVSSYLNWLGPSGSSIIGQYVLDYNIYFAIGVACYHYSDKIAPYFIFKSKRLFYVVATVLFLVMVVARFWINSDQNKITLSIAGLFSIILLFNFLEYKIKNSVLAFLGNISYSIYISHFATLILLVGIFFKTGIISSVEIQNKFLWLSGIPAAIIVSYLFYLLAEKPTKDILSKMRKKP